MANFVRLTAVALMSAAFAAPVMAQDLAFTLANNSGVDLVEIYASSKSATNWGENILRGGALSAGRSGQVKIAGGATVCAYDLRMVFADGDVLEDSSDLCQAAVYTVQ